MFWGAHLFFGVSYSTYNNARSQLNAIFFFNDAPSTTSSPSLCVLSTLLSSFVILRARRPLPWHTLHGDLRRVCVRHYFLTFGSCVYPPHFSPFRFYHCALRNVFSSLPLVGMRQSLSPKQWKTTSGSTSTLS